MADLACDLCGEERAILLQTKVDTGEVIGVGEACVFPFVVGTATALAATMPDEVKAAYVGSVGALAEAVGVTAKPAARKARKAADAAPADGAAGGDGGGGQGGTEAPDEPFVPDAPAPAPAS